MLYIYIYIYIYEVKLKRSNPEEIYFNKMLSGWWTIFDDVFTVIQGNTLYLALYI